MSKKNRVNYVQRDASTGKLAVDFTDRKKINARSYDVQRPGISIRRARTLAKNNLTYNSNVGFIVENDRKESESAALVRNKSRSTLENKYMNIVISTDG